MSRLYESMLYSGSGSNDQRLPAFSFGQGKPGLSFPLGTGLVVFIILVVSALFSFCYHWMRLRKAGSSLSLPTSSLTAATEALSDTDCSKTPTKLFMVQCPPVVYMAGEEMPRFIAVPCTWEGKSCKPIEEDGLEKGMPKPLDILKLDIRL